jgi:hypothetical protein
METTSNTCLDARRALDGDPRRLTRALERHVTSCPGCAARRAGLLALDARLAAALRLPAPEGLADRVLLRQGLARSLAPRRLALAAALVVALGASGLFGAQRWQQAPAREAIAHVLEEEPHELLHYRRVDEAALGAAVRAAGLTLDRSTLEIRYLGTCPFRGGHAHHILLGTPFGKATLLLTPGRPLQSAVVAQGRGLTALAAPAPTGNWFLIADSRDALQRIAELVRR